MLQCSFHISNKIPSDAGAIGPQFDYQGAMISFPLIFSFSRLKWALKRQNDLPKLIQQLSSATHTKIPDIMTINQLDDNITFYISDIPSDAEIIVW